MGLLTCQGKIKNFSKKDLKEFIKVYKKASQSLVDFRRLFLAGKDDVAPAKFHYEWSDILLNGKDHYVIQAFRESGKSQLVLRAFPLYALTFPDPSRRYIVLIKNNATLAKNKLKEIKNEYLANPFLCVNLITIMNEREDLFFVKVRDFKNQKESIVRIEAYGKGSSIRGLSWGNMRPSIVVIDDPQDVEDMNSETILAKDWEWFLSDVKFLGQKTRLFVIGNNLGEKCLVERIIANHKELNFEYSRVPVLDKDGNPTWPEKYSKEEVIKERENFRKVGKIDIWYREKMGVSMSPENQIFKKEWFKYYAPPDIKRESLEWYITVDLAVSEKKDADYTAIVVCGVKDNNWFIDEIEYGHFDPSDTIERLFRLASKYRPIYVGIEKVAYQQAFIHFLEKEMLRRSRFLNVFELKAEKAKEIRIKALQPRFKLGTIWFKINAPYLDELERELLMFPRGKHDDLIDALAYLEQMVTVNTSWQDDTEIPAYSL